MHMKVMARPDMILQILTSLTHARLTRTNGSFQHCYDYHRQIFLAIVNNVNNMQWILLHNKQYGKLQNTKNNPVHLFAFVYLHPEAEVERKKTTTAQCL